MKNINQQNKLQIIYYKNNTEQEKLQNKYKSKKRKATKRLNLSISEEDYIYIDNKSAILGMSKGEFLIYGAKQLNTEKNNRAIIPAIVKIDELVNKLPAEEKNKIRPLLNELKDNFYGSFHGGNI
jgi:hypothetical protein